MGSWQVPEVASAPVQARASVLARERSAPATASRTRPGRRSKGVASPDSGIAAPIQTQALPTLDACNHAMTLTLLPCASAQRAFIAPLWLRNVARLRGHVRCNLRSIAFIGALH